MKPFITIALTILSLLVFVGGKEISKIQVTPKLSAFQESVRKSASDPESKVTITVGEKNGFVYTVNGYTNSIYKIAVSGEYFNDEPSRYGYARIFLVVDTGVAYYSLRPYRNILDIYILNNLQYEFFFEIICPFPVTAHDLYEGQINATAVLVTGPSRSSVHYIKASETEPELPSEADEQHIQDVKENVV